MWRLTRCGEVEAGFLAALSTGSEPIPDPMQNDSTAKLQNSVDRARAQSHRLLHRCTSELRRLQTERCFRDEIFTGEMDTSGLGLADYRAITKSMADDNRGQMLRRKLKDLHSFKSVLEMSLPETPPASSESSLDSMEAPPQTPPAKQTQSTGSHGGEIARNAPCTCNSGQKYKRCCGRNAPALRATA
jgi:hypothetical protein